MDENKCYIKKIQVAYYFIKNVAAIQALVDLLWSWTRETLGLHL